MNAACGCNRFSVTRFFAGAPDGQPRRPVELKVSCGLGTVRISEAARAVESQARPGVGLYARRAGRDRLTAALAAAEALAGLGDGQGLRQGVAIDVSLMAAIGA
jgi:hypothetical protein